MRRMTQKDWRESSFRCPKCQSSDCGSSEVAGHQQHGAYEYDRECYACGTLFVEILKLTGYKIVGKTEVDPTRNDPDSYMIKLSNNIKEIVIT